MQLVAASVAGWAGNPWASNAVALVLEITPDNQRARRLYERVGFRARNLAMCRRLRD